MKKRIFYFDEDLINIPIFTPIENSKAIQKYIDTYDKQLEKGHIEGPKEIILLEERRIKLHEIDNSFKSLLPPYDEVRFEISPEEVEYDYFAYGSENIFVFGTFNMVKNKVITNLAIHKGFENIKDKSLIDKLSAIIFNFCREKRLIIFDDFTENKIMIQAKSFEKVKNYLSRPWKKSN